MESRESFSPPTVSITVALRVGRPRAGAGRRIRPALRQTNIYFCSLGQFLSKPGDYVLLVAGHTTLPAGTVREIRASSTLTLPCGITATMTRFIETANAVISPPGTPNGLGVQSGKVADVCPR